MRWSILGLLVALLASCTSSNQVIQGQNEDPTQDPVVDPGIATPTATPSPLPDLGPAPELANEIWLNSDTPLRLADLRGKVVLLDMWTFG
jgi:hypothetical protein